MEDPTAASPLAARCVPRIAPPVPRAPAGDGDAAYRAPACEQRGVLALEPLWRAARVRRASVLRCAKMMMPHALLLRTMSGRGIAQPHR